MKYDWNKLTEEQKQLAVNHEMELVTHNGTTKEDFINIMHFLQETIETQQQEIEQLRAKALLNIANSDLVKAYGGSALEKADEHIEQLERENERLKQWVNDLQSGMYVNCVYCGHRYGPERDTPASMADILKEHIEQCPEHPMSKLKQEIAKAKAGGHLVVLPCKVGDMVYEPRKDRNIISMYEITEIIINQYGVSFFRWNLIEGIYSYMTGFPVECLGKTVFLTYEAAQKALKGGEQDDRT